jgi:type IV secretory pathway TrbD component
VLGEAAVLRRLPDVARSARPSLGGMTGPRQLVLLNGLTALACVLHVLVHAFDLNVGVWHDHVLYALVAMSFVASLAYVRTVERTEPAAA